MLKQKSAITLIALVITIVVLLVLAVVIINLSLGENGIIGKVQTAVDKYKQAENSEQELLNNIYNYIDKTYQLGNTRNDEADLKDSLLKMIYPVGSIYCSVSNVDPGTFLGGTWTRISQGRVLMGATDTEEGGYVAGQTKNAGLPNITGYINACNNVEAGTTPGSGAFQAYGRWKSQYINKPYSADWDVIPGYTFDASRSSQIYGASDTVQPPAYIVYMWQRTE